MVLTNYTKNDILNVFLKKRNINKNLLEKLANPRIEDLNDPSLLQDSSKFIDLLYANKDKHISIIPDYDADGVMSGSLLYAGLSLFDLKHKVYTYAPNTHTGYGTSVASVDELLLAKPDTDVIITTDNGVAAFDGIAYAKSKGLIVLVSDHHLGGESEPIADVVVDPNRLTDTYPFKSISGTVVIWKLLQLYSRKYCTPDVVSAIDDLIVFAGISTISDVMQLLDENRYIVKKTVELMSDESFLDFRIKYAKGTSYANIFRGLKALMAVLKDNGKLNYGIDEGTIGFYISPMLNSPRRMSGYSTVGFDLFDQDTYEAVKEVAENLYTLNEERKSIVNKISRRLLSELAKELTPGVVSVVNTRPGFAGLIAGQVTNKFSTPSIIFTHESESDSLFVDINSLDISDDMVFHASARSPQNFHIYNALVTINKLHPEYFSTFGGHGQAAGLGIYAKHYLDFKQAFHNYVAEFGSKVDSLVDSSTEVTDVVISVQNTYVFRTPDFILSDENNKNAFVEAVSYFEKLAPYGEGFRQPGFRLSFSTDDASTGFMGADKQHVKFVLPGGFTVIQWNGATFLKESLGHLKAPFYFEVKGKMSINKFRNNITLQLIADDIVLTETPIESVI